MRILMISTRFAPTVGSAENRALDLACALAGRGVEVTILTCRRPEEQAVDHLFGLRVVRLEGDGPLGFFGAVLVYLFRRASEFDGLWCPAGAPAALAASAAGWWFDKRVLLRLGSAGEQAVGEGRPARALRRAVRLGVWIAAEDTAELRRRIGSKRVRCVVVPAGVDAAHFSPPLDPSGRARRRTSFGFGKEFVAVCPAVEGSETGGIERAWARAIGDRAVLVVAGPSLEDPGAPLGVRRLRVEGDLFKLYQAADAAVFPPGASPDAVLRAMAAGLPVLAPADPALLALVEEGRTGFTYEPAFAAAIETRILELAAGGKRLEEVGAAARGRVLERYAYERIAARYLQVLTGPPQHAKSLPRRNP